MSSKDISEDKKIVKIIEKDDRCNVFFISTRDGEDGLYIYKLKMKKEGDRVLYSTAMYATGAQWDDSKFWKRELSK